MTQSYFIILLVGIIIVLLSDAITSIASRKFNINYKILSVFSILLQLLITGYAALTIGTVAAITIGGLISLIDAVLGYQITLKLKPNLGEEEKEALDLFAEDGKPKVQFVLVLVVTGLFVGWIGSLLAKFLQ